MGTRVDNRAFEIEHPPLAISDSAATAHQPTAWRNGKTIW